MATKTTTKKATTKTTATTKKEATTMKATKTTTKKEAIKVPTLPKNPRSFEDFAGYLLSLNDIEGMSTKTWEKIKGCYSIKYRGKIVGEFYLSEKKGTYRISTRSTYFTKVPSNGVIIKNGLDLNVAKCDNISAGVAFIKNVIRQIADKANGKEIKLYEEDNFVNPKETAEEVNA